MSRRSVKIREKVKQYQRTHAGATGKEALANVATYASSEKREAQESALHGPHHGNGGAS